MLEIFIFVLGLIIGYVYCIKSMATSFAQVLRNIEKRSNKLGKDIQTIDSNEVIKLTHHVIENIHYFYLTDSNTFVCQGPTLADAAKAFSTVCPGVACFVTQDTGINYLFKDGCALAEVNE